MNRNTTALERIIVKEINIWFLILNMFIDDVKRPIRLAKKQQERK